MLLIFDWLIPSEDGLSKDLLHFVIVLEVVRFIENDIAKDESLVLPSLEALHPSIPALLLVMLAGAPERRVADDEDHMLSFKIAISSVPAVLGAVHRIDLEVAFAFAMLDELIAIAKIINLLCYLLALLRAELDARRHKHLNGPLVFVLLDEVGNCPGGEQSFAGAY